MTSLVFGYVVVSLVTATTMTVLEARFAEVAALYGASLDGRMYYEHGCPAPLLWSLITDSDQAAAQHITTLACRRGVNLDKLLATSTGHATAFWQLAAALETAGGGYVLIPSPIHLDGMGIPQDVLRRRIADLNGQVIWIDAPKPSIANCVPITSTGLVAQFRLTAFGAATAVARATIEQRLSRAGLRHMVDAAVAVVVEVVEAAEQRWSKDILDAFGEDIIVRLTCPPDADALVVEIHESRENSGDPVAGMPQQISHAHPVGNTIRFQPAAGGTVTRCTIPLTSPDPESNTADNPERGSIAALADALHRYRSTVTETCPTQAVETPTEEIPHLDPRRLMQVEKDIDTSVTEPRGPAIQQRQPVSTDQDTLRRIAEHLRHWPREPADSGKELTSSLSPPGDSPPQWQHCLHALDSLAAQLRDSTAGFPKVNDIDRAT